jgi:hypothetical protein
MMDPLDWFYQHRLCAESGATYTNELEEIGQLQTLSKVTKR